jgi:hypothetical protein
MTPRVAIDNYLTLMRPAYRTAARGMATLVAVLGGYFSPLGRGLPPLPGAANAKLSRCGACGASRRRLDAFSDVELALPRGGGVATRGG